MSTEKALKDEIIRLTATNTSSAEVVEQMERCTDFLFRGTIRTVRFIRHIQKEGDLVNVIKEGQKIGILSKDITEEQINLILDVLVEYLSLATEQFAEADRAFVHKHLTALYDTTSHQTH